MGLNVFDPRQRCQTQKISEIQLKFVRLSKGTKTVTQPEIYESIGEQVELIPQPTRIEFLDSIGGACSLVR